MFPLEDLVRITKTHTFFTVSLEFEFKFLVESEEEHIYSDELHTRKELVKGVSNHQELLREILLLNKVVEILDGETRDDITHHFQK